MADADGVDGLELVGGVHGHHVGGARGHAESGNEGLGVVFEGLVVSPFGAAAVQVDPCYAGAGEAGGGAVVERDGGAVHDDVAAGHEVDDVVGVGEEVGLVELDAWVVEPSQYLATGGLVAVGDGEAFHIAEVE